MYDKNSKQRLIAFQVPEDMYEDMTKIADEYFLSLSGLIRMALIKFIREQNTENLKINENGKEKQ